MNRLRFLLVFLLFSCAGIAFAQAQDSGGARPNNIRPMSPEPYADITAYGAFAPGGAFPVTTANCTKGSNQIRIKSANTFRLNEGVTIYGCGPTNTLGTPSELTVTPSEPWGLASTESAVSSPKGNATYEYTVVARDIYGALTAPATPVTIANGLPSLGLQTADIKTLSRSNDRITVVTTAPNNLVYSSLVELEPKDSKQFGGWYNIAKIDSPTQFELWTTQTDTRAQGWMVGDTTSYSGGGKVAFYQENYLKWTPLAGAWEYYVCAKRPGENSLKLIGVTKPTGLHNGYIDAAFEDYGSPYMDGQAYPSYVTNSICTGAASNDPLSTWVTAVSADGLTYTLNAAASQTVSDTKIVFDDAPGIMRALKAASYQSPEYLGGSIYIPPSKYPYVINSYLQIPRQVTIWQSGKLAVNETIALESNVNWYGDWSSQGTPQFGFNSGAVVNIGSASPGLYLMGTGNTFRTLNILSNTPNGALDLLADNAAPSNFEYVEFETGAGGNATDHLGMAVVLRDSTQTISNYHFNKVGILTGPDQVNDVSWTPSFWVAPPQAYGNSGIEVTMDKTTWNRRGIGWGGGDSGTAGPGGVADFVSNWSYRQGGIIPFFACMNCTEYATLTFNEASQDTEGQPLEAAFINFPNSGYLGQHITALHPTGGAQTPLFGGVRPSFADVDSLFESAKAFQNRDILFKTGGIFKYVYAPYATTGTYAPQIGSMDSIVQPMHGAGGYSWWFDTMPPKNVSASAPEKGGNIPLGTYVYAVSMTGADGGETITSAASPPISVSAAGDQQIHLTWTGSPGAYSYNVYRCNTTPKTPGCYYEDGTIGPNNLNPWYQVGQHVMGTSFSDTFANPQYKWDLSQASGTGSTVLNNTGVYSPVVQAETVSAGGGAVFGSAEISTAAACESDFGTTRISAAGPATVTGLACIPASAYIDAVVYRVTKSITRAASFTVGVAGAASKFCAAQSTLTAGATGICNAQINAGVPVAGSSPAPIVVTFNTTPGDGVIRLIVYYHTWKAPTN